MNKRNKIRYGFTILLLMTIGVGAYSQTGIEASMQTSIDTEQRGLMKDSLGISDDVITQVFSLRDNYFSKVAAIRSDKTLSAADQERQTGSAVKELNEKLKAVLGQSVYTKYKTMIGRRAQKRAANRALFPLGSNQ